MRLWHYKLLSTLPDKFIIAQWRECIAIKRQWEKGTLKHRLVSYVMDYDKDYFFFYTVFIITEMAKRKIRFNNKYYQEIIDFCKTEETKSGKILYYPEHNDRYLLQCFYNLEEKYDRGIISEDEWQKIKFLIRFGKPKNEMKFLKHESCEWCGGKLYENYYCSECGKETECK